MKVKVLFFGYLKETTGDGSAAVELPEASFPNTDFASAFFGVSVNKALTAVKA